MHHAFKAATEEASILGAKVTGSEIVGLIPKRALIETGLYYIKKEGSKACSEKELIDIAVYSLGLNDVTDFNPDKKIIEYRIQNKTCL
jgi:glutamate formiminotransferase/formiminotetrahydrofolate cyclodeaminase